MVRCCAQPVNPVRRSRLENDAMGVRTAALTGLLTIVAGTTGVAGEDDVLRQGEALLTKGCAQCHAVGRTGASPDPQAVPFRTLARKYPIESLEEALGEGILADHSGMPELEFSADEVGAITAYLRAIQEP
jgi:cytochrome c